MKNSISASHSVAKSYGWQAQVKLANNQSERGFPHATETQILASRPNVIRCTLPLSIVYILSPVFCFNKRSQTNPISNGATTR